MTIRGRHRLAASVLLAATGAACGGGTTQKSKEPTAPNTTISVAARANPAVVGSEPNVIDHGDDFVAIASSLVLFVRWLESHNPDPTLVERAYQLGSPPERVASEHVAELQRTDARIVEVDTAPFEFTLISVTRNVVSLRLTEHLAHRELIAADGRVLARDGARTEQYLISIARSKSERPWRVNFVERQGPRIEVQL